MIKVIGVRFRQAGKIYYFDPLDFDIEVGQHVIVETARGIEYGLVLTGPRNVEADKVIQPLKPVIRVATPDDDEVERKNKEKEKTPAILALFPHTACTSGAGAHSGCLLFLRRLRETG